MRRGRWLLELLLVAVAFAAVSAWLNRDLLPADSRAPAPAFELVDLDGVRWTRESLAGRPTVLYFFAPWCGVCAASSPQLRWFARWSGDSVRLVLVGLDWQSLDELRAYAARHRIEAPVLAGDAATAAAFRIRGYPTYYVLDAGTRVAARDSGYTTAPGLAWRSWPLR